MSKKPNNAAYHRPKTSKPQPGRPVPKNLGHRGPADHHAAEQEDDFRPPNPKSPVAGAKPGVVIGLTMVLAGIVALVSLPFILTTFPGWAIAALIGVILLGIVILFMQMPAKKSRTGDGAQV